MSAKLREQAVIVADRIRKELKPSSILFFGSVARGAEIEGSDLDLCMVFEHMPGRKIDVMRRARMASRPVFKGAMDVLAYSREEWEAYLAAGSGLEVGIREEAIARHLMSLRPLPRA